MSNWSSQANVNQTVDSVQHIGLEREAIEVYERNKNFALNCTKCYTLRTLQSLAA